MLNGLVYQRFVFDHFGNFDAAGGGNQGLGLGIFNANGQFVCGKPAEDHRMDSAEPGAGQHGDGCLRNHRHVDDDAVTFFDSAGAQGAGKQSDFITQFVVGK